MEFNKLKDGGIYFSDILQLKFQVIVDTNCLVFEDGVVWKFDEIGQPMNGRLVNMLHLMKRNFKLREVPYAPQAS